ncbi:endoribonuclease-like protein L-psp [Mytilinidion resinicola]|uniref:Endoribonuclease-like protein L-psp n=1 Tax=Mytilinidion resinicola TaxID=574789 RepID=A0A6A6YYX3_9PEZI|nr:endoribonuclease-like protein L-psp [Mytilinidion resinicola]KAF2813748.1 endoribonuclease-like protein L-psp [Mytilinidion resinicola]
MSHLQYSDYEGYGDRARKEVHYSQAVRYGSIIEISGQGGWDRISEAIPALEGPQIDQAFANVEHTLQKAGGKGWSQVYKVRCYVVKMDTLESGHIVRNLRKYCPDHQPILTVVGVESLALKDMRIEIEVAAHLGE